MSKKLYTHPPPLYPRGGRMFAVISLLVELAACPVKRIPTNLW
jgi:hypothetical protein